jgi:hypothetical protein
MNNQQYKLELQKRAGIITEAQYRKRAQLLEAPDGAFGSDKPVKLSDIPDAQTAKQIWQAGKVDGSTGDDAADTKEKTQVPVGELKPMQKEVIPDKALSFALGYLRDGKPDLDDMEAIISNDSYIMDGHHRWAARTLIDPAAQVTVAAIDMPATDVVSALNLYTKAIGIAKGNPGKGDVTKFASAIPALIDKAGSEGNSGFDSKAQWPKISAEEMDELLGKVPGANGDAEKGRNIMIANAKELPTAKHPNAPERVDMPVIDAAKGDLTKALKMINSGEIDLKPPFSKTTKAALGKMGLEVPDDVKEVKTKLQESVLAYSIREFSRLAKNK